MKQLPSARSYEKKQLIKPKESIDIIEKKPEINKIENRHIIDKINKAPNWS